MTPAEPEPTHRSIETGFTVSSLPAGDKQSANRLGSWSGLMAQAGHAAAADAFAAGDIKTARMFGRHFAKTLHRTLAWAQPEAEEPLLEATP